MGAVSNQLAGALYGEEGYREPWRSWLRGAELIESYATNLFELSA
jgi:hypothetical protein